MRALDHLHLSPQPLTTTKIFFVLISLLFFLRFHIQVRLYRVCLSLPGLFQAASCPLVLPCCHTSWLPLSQLNNPTCVCSTSSYPPVCPWTLGGFRVLAAVANAAANTGRGAGTSSRFPPPAIASSSHKTQTWGCWLCFSSEEPPCCFPARLRQHRSFHASLWPWTTADLDFTTRSHPSDNGHGVSTSRHVHGPCSGSATSLPRTRRPRPPLCPCGESNRVFY